MLELGMKIFSLYPFESHGKESNAVNAGLMLVPVKILPSIRLLETPTYICALHWPGQRGPNDDFLDPLKANFTAQRGSVKSISPEAYTVINLSQESW